MRYATVWIAALVCSSLAGAQAPPQVATDSATGKMADSSAVEPGLEAQAASLVLVTGADVDDLRTDQLRAGVARGQSLLLRSPSSLTPRAAGGWRASPIAPQILIVSNSALPFSQNDGALWAGKGVSSRTLLGFKLESPRVRFIFAPEIILSENADWPLFHDFYVPDVPEVPSGRGALGYVLPYYFRTFPIDQPMRFGTGEIQRFDLGQSTLMLSAGPLDLGISKESQWWGPGIRNAIVLSNNAPGFPHLFLRTARPIETRLGSVEASWLVGGLEESNFFDTVTTNDVRSISSLALTLQTRWNPNLSFGLARSVYATATGWGQIPFRWLHAITPANSPGRFTPNDTTQAEEGRDHLFSLFARWVFPADGAEVYAEWARTRFPDGIRSFVTAPNHTQGYTLGAQWRGASWRNGTFRLQAEVTQLEQSATFRDRRLGSWYASPRVTQGYTHRGEVLGAAIGPGASSQWLAVDYLQPRWRLGAFFGRIRWNEDVHSTYGFPEYVAYCSHDVSIYPGIRAGKVSALGTISAELSFQNRQNAFFQNGGGCPNNGRRLDIRNNTLSITFSPFDRR